MLLVVDRGPGGGVIDGHRALVVGCLCSVFVCRSSVIVASLLDRLVIDRRSTIFGLWLFVICVRSSVVSRPWSSVVSHGSDRGRSDRGRSVVVR